MYKTRGFNIDVLHGDKKFNLNALRDHIRPAGLNICENGQKSPIIERSIKTTEQGVRCTTHYVTYKIYTNLIKSSIFKGIMHSRNSFTQKGSIRNILGSTKYYWGR